jgi:murein DD-endopeptidase MepM/ murein hydrolase activator NlpD
VIVRALAWWVDVPGDLRKGDKLDVVYEERPNEEPVVHALRFESGKLAQTFRAYRYKAPDSRFAHFYQPGGEEVEKRLVNGPLDDYEQITSLLRDGRGHKGVDFKTPVGTQVKAPFDGVITRRNWNVKMNGDSVELRETGAQGTPRVAMFLHLSEILATIQPGIQVARGRVIAQSGNTGHSFAPHLHYQLEGGGVVLDPFQSHATERRTLPDADKPAFSVEMKRLDALFDGNAPASGSAAVGAAPPAGSTPPAGSAHAIGGTGAGSGT